MQNPDASEGWLWLEDSPWVGHDLLRTELALPSQPSFLPPLLCRGSDLHCSWSLSLPSQVSPLSPSQAVLPINLLHVILSWCLLLREPRLTHHPFPQKVLPVLPSKTVPGDSVSTLHLPHKLSLSFRPEMIFPQNSHSILNFAFGIYGLLLCICWISPTSW